MTRTDLRSQAQGGGSSQDRPEKCRAQNPPPPGGAGRGPGVPPPVALVPSLLTVGLSPDFLLKVQRLGHPVPPRVLSFHL